MLKVEKQSFEALYYQGLSPKQIVYALSVDRKPLYNWMYARGYRCLSKRSETSKSLLKNSNVMRYKELYKQGYTDYRIAIRVGVSKKAVYMRRKRKGLRRVT